ncbi:MAG: RtcB family protein [bacterium]
MKLSKNFTNMKITNLSSEPLGVLYSWLPDKLKAEHVVFLPDACPGKSPLPTGTAVYTQQTDWRQFAISDCGCGMRLLKSTLTIDKLNQSMWDSLAGALRKNRGMIGDLGGGNHFLDALLPYSENYLYFLIHTGSRQESGVVNDLINSPYDFDREFQRIVGWAENNRAIIQKIIENIIGNLELVLDLPHNTYEQLENGVIIRKGSVRLYPNQLSILPSHMSGDAVLIRAKEKINEILYSMSHGTGRIMSRSDAKEMACQFDFTNFRSKIIMPSMMSNASITTEGPYAYRNLEDCLLMIKQYIEEVERFSVVAYAGHL